MRISANGSRSSISRSSYSSSRSSNRSRRSRNSRNSSRTRRDKVDIRSRSRRRSVGSKNINSRYRTKTKSNSSASRAQTRYKTSANSRTNLSRNDSLNRNKIKQSRNTYARHKTNSASRPTSRKTPINTTYNQSGRISSRKNYVNQKLTDLERTENSNKIKTYNRKGLVASLETDAVYISKENKNILNAKEEWWKARLKNDETGMRRAHQKAEAARSRGGTIKVDDVTFIDKQYLSKLEAEKFLTDKSLNVSHSYNPLLGFSGSKKLIQYYTPNEKIEASVHYDIPPDANIYLKSDGSFSFKGKHFELEFDNNIRVSGLTINNVKISPSSLEAIIPLTEKSEHFNVTSTFTVTSDGYMGNSTTISDKQEIIKLEGKILKKGNTSNKVRELAHDSVSSKQNAYLDAGLTAVKVASEGASQLETLIEIGSSAIISKGLSLIGGGGIPLFADE